MKLASLTFEPYALPFRQAFQTARERLDVRRGFLVRVRDAEGREGIGEAAPIDGFGMESFAEARSALVRWARHLVDLPLLPAGGMAGPLRTALPGAARTPAACHGLESALADLAAQAAGMPLSHWLLRAIGAGGSVSHTPASLAVNATLGALPPGEAARVAAAFIAEGFRTIKVKVGDGAQDAARIRAVHHAMRRAAPDALLRADANGAWDEATARAWLVAHEYLELEYLEQPVPAGSPAGDAAAGGTGERAMGIAALSRLVATGTVPIAADESVLSEDDARAVLAARAAQVLVLKPMALGGPLAALLVAKLALAAGARIVITTSLEGAAGRMAALHVAAAAEALAAGAGTALPAHGLATGSLLRTDLVDDPPLPSKGRLAAPSASGLGLAIPRSPEAPSPE